MANYSEKKRGVRGDKGLGESIRGERHIRTNNGN